jgi:hypothetical protein
VAECKAITAAVQAKPLLSYSAVVGSNPSRAIHAVSCPLFALPCVCGALRRADSLPKEPTKFFNDFEVWKNWKSLTALACL